MSRSGLLLFVAVCMLAPLTHAADPQAQRFDIPGQELADALKQFAVQSRCEILFTPEDAAAKRTAGVKGQYVPAEALRIILTGTGLKYRVTDGDSIVIEKQQTRATKEVSMRLAQVDDPARRSRESAAEAANEVEDVQGVPEILVKGNRSLNSDIKRTEDAPQPYVVFDSEEIQRSQAVNLGEFLRTRLPMNAASTSNAQSTGSALTNSTGINLRGLGDNQTLILVDGRRMPNFMSGGTPLQPDLNGIPLASIERIEVLPSTAGGIYGGSATGGVVNIVLRRDFRGVDAKATYANTFDTDTGNTRIDASAGFSLEGGRTQVLIAATHSKANELAIGDRDFTALAVARQAANNLNAITFSTTPPLGATPNIRSVSGNLTLDAIYGGASFGSNIVYIPRGYAGAASDNGAALRANAGRYNLDIPAGMLGADRGLLAASAQRSFTLNVRREFGSRIEAFVDLSRFGNEGSSPFANIPNAVFNLPANAPNNPFQQAINVRFPAPELSGTTRSAFNTTRGTGGIIARLAGNWTGQAEIGWRSAKMEQAGVGTVIDFAGSTSLATGFAPGDGRPALNVLQDSSTFPIDFSRYLMPVPNTWTPSEVVLKTSTLRLSGPAANLPGGPMTLSALVEYRTEEMQDSLNRNIDSFDLNTYYFLYPRRSQDVNSYYVEARAPLISGSNALPGVRELELQASVRRDSYETMGTSPADNVPVDSPDGPFPEVDYIVNRAGSTDYTLALRYKPVEDLTLRASFGTGFMPAAINLLGSSEFIIGTPVGILDPRRGNTEVFSGIPILRITGGSPALRPEKSESTSVGLILAPRFAPGLRVSVDYTRIDKTDEVVSPAFDLMLTYPELFPGRLVRGANLPGDPVGWAGPINRIDLSVMNFATSSVEAFDIQADYNWQTGDAGEFHAYSVVTWQPHYKNQVLPVSVVVDRVGFSGGVLEWRGNVGLDWRRNALTLGWNTQYYDSYFAYSAVAAPATITSVTRSQGSPTIPRQIYHDLIVTWRVGAIPGFSELLSGSELSFGIQNVFNTAPPIISAANFQAPGYSTYGDPRLRRYTLSIRKSFGN